MVRVRLWQNGKWAVAKSSRRDGLEPIVDCQRNDAGVCWSWPGSVFQYVVVFSSLVPDTACSLYDPAFEHSI